MSENINQLKEEIELLREKLDEEKNVRKKQTIELGQIIFKNEDLEYEIKKLKKENKELLEFKKEVEKSKSWKIKSFRVLEKLL